MMPADTRRYTPGFAVLSGASTSLPQGADQDEVRELAQAISRMQATRAPNTRSRDAAEEAYRVRRPLAPSVVAVASPLDAKTGTSIEVSSERRRSIVSPGRSRPMTCSERIDGRVEGSSVGTPNSKIYARCLS